MRWSPPPRRSAARCAPARVAASPGAPAAPPRGLCVVPAPRRSGTGRLRARGAAGCAADARARHRRSAGSRWSRRATAPAIRCRRSDAGCGSSCRSGARPRESTIPCPSFPRHRRYALTQRQRQPRRPAQAARPPAVRPLAARRPAHPAINACGREKHRNAWCLAPEGVSRRAELFHIAIYRVMFGHDTSRVWGSREGDGHGSGEVDHPPG